MGRAATKRSAARATTRRPTATANVEPPAAAPSRASAYVGQLRELSEVAATRRELFLREAELVDALRLQGISWRQIGEALGTSPQAVQQRYARVGL